MEILPLLVFALSPRPQVSVTRCSGHSAVSASTSIRITYVIPTLDQSGAERQLTLLATALPNSDFQVNVIALNRGGYYAEQLQQADIRVDVLEKRFRFDPLTFLRLRRRLQRTQPDIVQSFLFSANSYVRLPGMCPPQTKVIVSERCVDSWKSGWQLATDRRLISRTDAMTANSESVADFYTSKVGVPRDRITVIPNGVPIAGGGEGSIRAELGLAESDKLVGFVGRLAPQKCLDDLIYGFQLMQQNIPSAHLLIVGEGPERDRLAELARSFECREKVFFAGHREDASQLISQLDAFCLPSSFEGMSNSLMEAMAAGVPVVVSNIPSNQELVTDGENGILFPLNHGPGITKGLTDVLSDQDLAKRLGQAARTTIEQKHSVARMVDDHIRLYQRLAHEKM